MSDRDRDVSGKARNSRPRDALGRPLPHGSQGVPRIPDDLDLPADESLTYAQQLLDEGLAFNAHEVLEAAWKQAPESDRAMWQGLAQLAVGITHIQRGNGPGAQSVLARAADRLGQTPNPVPHNVDSGRLIAHSRALIEDVRNHDEISEERLRPRLRRES